MIHDLSGVAAGARRNQIQVVRSVAYHPWYRAMEEMAEFGRGPGGNWVNASVDWMTLSN
jgi:hypothetical protein